MKFSIILPVKNGGEYIKECVQSILSQTCRDFNLHILENWSTDGTAEWIHSLKDDRIIIIPSQKPLSIEENWARILSISKNEFMTIIGHDDLFDEDYLQIMNDLTNQHPDASLYQTQFRFIDAKGNFIRHCRPMDEKQTAAEFLQSLFTNSIDTMGTGYMLRSKDYNNMEGIKPFPNLLFADHALWIKSALISYKATSSRECFSYRLHENLSKISDAPRYINAFYKYLDFLTEIKHTQPAISETIEKYVNLYIQYYCRSLSHRLLKTPIQLRDKITISEFINRCKEYVDILSSKNDKKLFNQFNIKIAKLIDENLLLRNLYLLFRKFYHKPIYS